MRNKHLYFDRFAFELIVALQGVWVMIATITSNKVMTAIKKMRKKKGRRDNSNDTQNTPLSKYTKTTQR